MGRQVRWHDPVGALDGYAATVLRSESAARRARALVAASQSLLDRANRVLLDSGVRIARRDPDARDR